MPDTLHPRTRYAAAAKRLIVQLASVQTLFTNNGLYVPVELAVPPSATGKGFLIRWDPRRKEFGWRIEPTHQWRPLTGDINAPHADYVELAPVADLFEVLPELFDIACRERDRLAERMDIAAGSIEDWLQGIKPYPVQV